MGLCPRQNDVFAGKIDIFPIATWLTRTVSPASAAPIAASMVPWSWTESGRYRPGAVVDGSGVGQVLFIVALDENANDA